MTCIVSTGVGSSLPRSSTLANRIIAFMYAPLVDSPVIVRVAA